MNMIAGKEKNALNLSLRELSTLSAALSYWREEMLPHGRRIMRPYFRDLGIPQITPLNRSELERLRRRLRFQVRAQR